MCIWGKTYWHFQGIEVNLQINLGRIDIFMRFSLPIKKHCLFICSSLLFCISHVIGKFPQINLHISYCNQVIFFAVGSVSCLFIHHMFYLVIACTFESYCYLYNEVRISLLNSLNVCTAFYIDSLEFSGYVICKQRQFYFCL